MLCKYIVVKKTGRGAPSEQGRQHYQRFLNIWEVHKLELLFCLYRADSSPATNYPAIKRSFALSVLSRFTKDKNEGINKGMDHKKKHAFDNGLSIYLLKEKKAYLQAKSRRNSTNTNLAQHIHGR